MALSEKDEIDLQNSSESSPNSHPVFDRDQRIDVIRGLATLMVLIDHLEDQSLNEVVRSWTLISIGLSDAAEAFVFLSGLVFGRVYSRRLAERGLAFCVWKASARAISIYASYLLVIAAAIVIGVSFRNSSALLEHRLSLSHGETRCALWSILLCYQPYGTPILAFYAVCLPLMPLLLWLLLRTPALAWALSLGLYAWSQSPISSALPRFPWERGEWYFHPAAWQLLFFLGLVFGISTSFGPRSRFVSYAGVTLASMFLVACLFIRKGWLGQIPWLGQWDDAIGQFVQHWSDKTRLEPARVLHFLCIAFVLSQLLPRASAECWKWRIAKPLGIVGRYSLPVYAFDVFLTFLSIPIFEAIGNSSLTVALVDADGVGLSIAFACLLALIGRRS